MRYCLWSGIRRQEVDVSKDEIIQECNNLSIDDLCEVSDFCIALADALENEKN